MSNKTQSPAEPFGASKIIDVLLSDVRDLQTYYGRRLSARHNRTDAEKFNTCDKLTALLRKIR
jgi:hypothetical protein